MKNTRALLTGITLCLSSAFSKGLDGLYKMLAAAVAVSFASGASAAAVTAQIAGVGEVVYDDATGAVTSVTPSIVVAGLLVLFVVFLGVRLTRWAFGIIQGKAMGGR